MQTATGRRAALAALAAILALGVVMIVDALPHLPGDHPADAADHGGDRPGILLARTALSTEWHASTFAGSVVRRITRGMWAMDLLNDTLLVALLPSVVVLLATTVLLGLRWPAMVWSSRLDLSRFWACR